MKTYKHFCVHFERNSLNIYRSERCFLPIAVAARSKAWTVFARSNAGIVGSSPTQGMDVSLCLFCVCVVLRVSSSLATGWSPIQGVLRTVYRIKKLQKRPRSHKRTVEQEIDSEIEKCFRQNLQKKSEMYASCTLYLFLTSRSFRDN
jgi:hypothetical protein